MRINKYLAQATGLSRRAADEAIAQGRVLVNGAAPQIGQEIGPDDSMALDGSAVTAPVQHQTIMLNKPAGYVVSRDGQGDKTIYDLLSSDLHQLKPIGRLDKYSSGLLLLTNDGQLAQELTHPKYQKTKVYEVELSKALEPLHRQMISDHGVRLEDGPSTFELERAHEGNERIWRVRMHEGRNRQIRRTFLALGYGITRLHRTHFGTYELGALKPGAYEDISMPSSAAASPKR